jgi:hypothetical protein
MENSGFGSLFGTSDWRKKFASNWHEGKSTENSGKWVTWAKKGKRKGANRCKIKTQKACPNVVSLFRLSQKTGVSKSILLSGLVKRFGKRVGTKRIY